MFVSCPRCSQQNYPNATQCAYCGTALSPSLAGGPPQQPGFGNTGAPGFAGGATTGAGGGPGSAAVASQPQVGQLIDGKYRVERILGEGGMGIVYVAVDINADQKVVIKSIRPEFANRGDFRERTLAEGKALAKIDHQNVVRFNSIINSSETNELYIVMQFIEGESLDRTLEKANAAGQKLPITEVIRVFKQILDGVGAAHKEGLIHRDLKPANVLVRAKDGVAKVMDFGIAKSEGATKGPTQAGGIVGSLWYMAPEQIKGARDLDKRLDVYALGVVLYELTTGVVPFDGETEYDIMTKHMTIPVPSVKGLRPDAPDWMDQVIQRATAKERNDRFQSCEEMRAQIDQFDGGITVPRSATAFENSIIPEHSPSHISNPGGTAMMSGPIGLAPVIPPHPSQAGLPVAGHEYSAPPKKGGNGAVIGIIVAVLVVGGGAGAYFATRGTDEPKKGSGKSETKDPKEKDPKEKDPKENGGKDPKNTGTKPTETATKPPPPKKEGLDALVGTWKAETTNRLFKAVKDGDELMFRVVDESQFSGAYKKDDARFSLKKGEDDTSFAVTEFYRPTPPAGLTYSLDGLASCKKELTADDKGNPLVATLKSPTSLDVQFGIWTMVVDPPKGKEIVSCSATTGKGSVIAHLHKADDEDD